MTPGGWGSESQQILSALGMVFKRRKLILLISIAAVLASVVYYNQTAKPIYQGIATLVFEEHTTGVVGDVLVAPAREIQLFNRIEEIKSRAFADDIAESVPDELKARFLVHGKLRGNDLTSLISETIHQSLTAYPLRNSNLVRIRVQMSDPYLCMVVANLALKVLEDRNYRFRYEGATDLRRFVEDQLQRFSIQLKESDKNLMTFKEQEGISSLDAESTEMLRKMTDAEISFNATRANREATQEKLAAIERTLAEQRKELVPAVTSIASPSAQKLKEQLVELQAQYAQLVVQEYPENHPQRVRLQQEIEQTKKALADVATNLVKGLYVGDPIAQIERYMDEAISLQIEVESLAARERALEEVMAKYRRSLGGLPAKEVELARLLRERDVNAGIYTSLLERREEVRISEAKQIPNSRIIDRAELPRDPIWPRKALNLALGTLLGIIGGIGVGLVLESRVSKLSTLKFEQDTGWSVLALVPQIERARMRRRGRPTDGTQLWGRRERDLGFRLVSYDDPESAAGESYFMLRTRLELLGIGRQHRSLLVTSSAPQEGKSSTLSNLAATFGTAGLSTLVVDAELRRPAIHAIFGVRKEPGLSDLLLSRNGDGRRQRDAGEAGSDKSSLARPRVDASWEAALQSTRVNGVTVLASGKRIEQTQWEMAKAEMRGLLAEMGRRYNVVLVDSASPLLVHDTLVLCGMVDAVLVVVDAQSFDAIRLMETKRLLERAEANVLGAVVNKVDSRGRYSYYYSHHYSHQDA